MKDLVSVIVPVYKVEKYLIKCVDSICSQTYKKLEIILVDDGSPDSCGVICDEYAKKDNRIKVIHKENGGLSDARNAGMEIASGEYLMFVDSDDWLFSKAVETLWQRMHRDQSDLVIGSIRCMDINDQPLLNFGMQWLLEDRVYDALEYAFPTMLAFPMAVAKLYRRELVSEIRFPVGKLHEDEFTVHRFIGKCQKISTVSDVVYFYLQRENGIMHTAYHIKRLDVIEAFMERVIFYHDKRMYPGMERMYLISLVYMGNCCSKLDRTTRDNKKRISQLYQLIKAVGYRYVIRKASVPTIIRYWIYYISPELYYGILRLLGRIRGSK